MPDHPEISFVYDSGSDNAESPPPPPPTELANYEGGRYNFLSHLGSGAYSVVLKALDSHTNTNVAVKQLLPDTLDDHVDALAVLMEIMLLGHAKHPNVLSLYDIFMAQDLSAIYIVLPLLPSTLQALKKDKWLDDEKQKIVIHQILAGLRYMHTIKVVHRDLNPANVLVDTVNTCAKLCDFNLSSVLNDEGTCADARSYVVQRYYRAPELVLGSDIHGPAVDLWSVGCILGELCRQNRQSLFQGSQDKQLEAITEVLGSPPAGLLSKLAGTKEDLVYAQSLSYRSRVDFGIYFQNTKGQPLDSKTLELLVKLLQYDPDARPTASQALQFPLFEGCPTPPDGEVSVFRFSTEQFKSIADVRGCLPMVVQALQSASPSQVTKSGQLDSKSKTSSAIQITRSATDPLHGDGRSRGSSNKEKLTPTAAAAAAQSKSNLSAAAAPKVRRRSSLISKDPPKLKHTEGSTSPPVIKPHTHKSTTKHDEAITTKRRSNSHTPDRIIRSLSSSKESDTPPLKPKSSESPTTHLSLHPTHLTHTTPHTTHTTHSPHASHSTAHSPHAHSTHTDTSHSPKFPKTRPRSSSHIIT